MLNPDAISLLRETGPQLALGLSERLTSGVVTCPSILGAR